MKNLVMLALLIPLMFADVNESKTIDFEYMDLHIDSVVSDFKEKYDNYIKENYFNGEHKEDIIKKLNKYLNSTLKGKGEFITEYSLEVGIDPYLATAVMLQETGCYWTCSYLTRVCNNVGGNKGNPGCNGGSYRKFDTIEIGIKFAIDKLNSYYSKGLTTAKEIGPKYATDKTWYQKVNKYINKLKK
ncbi:MAG: glucosaminidase domain-containing protein [Tenericutes bacterium]|nr:glucosaminidase domain-containing protein [Mycoplasmatota bacterium]